MAYPLQDRYVNLLTDFGFKRVFGTEPNKPLAIDFLNTLLPEHHRIQDLTFKNTENLGSTPIDRKAIFDIYCQSKNGQQFIVEIQKAKQNFFKDRSVFYSTFPIQEQAQKGGWNYKLDAVYTVGVLDFVFDDHKNQDRYIHTVDLKDQDCQIFYDKLRFIYIELPKFTKTLTELDTQLDKWLFVLRHLSELEDCPQLLQEPIFNQLFEVAEIANFSPTEQDSYQNSLKYYRDMNNVVETSREEGREEGRQEERLLSLQRQRGLLLRQLSRKFGELPEDVQGQVDQLTAAELEELGEVFLEWGAIAPLKHWLNQVLRGCLRSQIQIQKQALLNRNKGLKPLAHPLMTLFKRPLK